MPEAGVRGGEVPRASPVSPILLYSIAVASKDALSGFHPPGSVDANMTVEEFKEKVARGGTVPLSASEWAGLASSLPEVERHNTQLAGYLVVARLGEDLVAVESPSREARVARLLGGPEEARAFVTRRLEEYERMWDGCGVKVDYYEPS